MTNLDINVVDQQTLEALILPEILPLCEGKPPGYLGVLLIDRLTRGRWNRQTYWRLETGEERSIMIRRTPDIPPGDWDEQAACKGQRMYYDTFQAHYTKITGKDKVMEREALITCNRCPVLEPCREWALQEIEPAIDHVAGGMTPRQRAEYRRRRMRGL